ncbi:MAG TPA: hypothetical protein P5243_03140 [Bacteroidales bacterium]|jgi:hypothetical protein|nr:hypothetical protein [Bacteroidales bacterium]HRS18476.1 hypothetical protein [Bacteroidales bacterium]
MKTRILICIVLFCLGGIQYSFSQTHAFTVYDTIPIRAGTNKFRLYKLIEKWFETERGTRLIAKNRKELHFKGKGYFIYYNRVKIPDIFLSPHANERCKGSIVFSIDVKIQDSIIVSKFTQFIHEAVYSEYGSMSFGMLMIYEKVPPGFCMEVEEWCNAVWNDMKVKSEAEVKDRCTRIIPPILIRRRTYKVKEEEVKVVAEEKVDPQEYLKLDKYYNPEDKTVKQVSTKTDDIPGITDVVRPENNGPIQKISKSKTTANYTQRNYNEQNTANDKPAKEETVAIKPEEENNQEKQAEEKTKNQENTAKEKPAKKEKTVSKPADDYDQEEETKPTPQKQAEAPKEKPAKETPAPKEKSSPAPKPEPAAKPAPAPKPAKAKPEPKKSKPGAADEYDDYDDE